MPPGVFGSAFGFCGQRDPLTIIQEDASVLFPLLLQNPHLFLEVLDGLPDLFVNAVCQACHERKPEVLFYSRQRLPDRWAVGQCFRHRGVQGRLAYGLRIRQYLHLTGWTFHSVRDGPCPDRRRSARLCRSVSGLTILGCVAACRVERQTPKCLLSLRDRRVDYETCEMLFCTLPRCRFGFTGGVEGLC